MLPKSAARAAQILCPAAPEQSCSFCFARFHLIIYFVLEVEPKGMCMLRCSHNLHVQRRERCCCISRPVTAVYDTESDPLLKSSAFRCSSSASIQQCSHLSSHEAAVRITQGNKTCLAHSKCSVNSKLLSSQPPQPSKILPVSSVLLSSGFLTPHKYSVTLSLTLLFISKFQKKA